MKKVILPALRAVIPAVLLSTAAFGLEIPLEYREIQLRQGEHPFGYANGLFTASPPAGTGTLPAFNSPRPLYALLRLGDGAHLVVLDARKPGDTKYMRLFVDRNGDGSLSGERPVDCRIDRMARGRSPLIELRIRTGSSTAPYRIQFYFDGLQRRGNTTRDISYQFQVACVYRGEFTLDGRRYVIELGDGNGNGRFGDVADFPKAGDGQPSVPMYVRGDQLLLTGEHDTPDLYAVHPFASHLWLHDTLYSVAADPTGKRILLTEVTRGLGAVRLSMLVETLYLAGENGTGVMVFRPAGTVLKLPSGSWRLVSYEARRKDENGVLWRLFATNYSQASPLVIAPGQEMLLAFGEPFSPEISLPTDRRLSTAISRLDFVLRGSGGERVSMLGSVNPAPSRFALFRRTGFTGKPAPPNYTIVKSDGEIVARGAFEYG